MIGATEGEFMMKTHEVPTIDAFVRKPLPKRFCNLDRLLHALKMRVVDGVVASPSTSDREPPLTGRLIQGEPLE
jgi:hypothetical protein